MAPCQGLLLDLDGTLVDDRTAVRTALAAFLHAHGCESGEGHAIEHWRALAALHWGRFERGEISFHDQRRARVRAFLGRELSDAEADAAFEPYRTAYEGAWKPYPDCGPFLERTAHLPKVVVTNGDRAQQLAKIARCGLDAHLRVVVTPEDCGAWKPDHRMFLTALRSLGLLPESCMMVGDDVDRDIGPARALGLRTFHVDRNDSSASLDACLP